MPCTFSHPLAVVPLRRFCPERLNFSALVIGSMSPDFGYYVRQFRLAGFAHTMLGSFAVCLPSGLLAVGLFYLLRQPLCFILPQPHRAAVMPLALRQPAFSLSAFLVTAVCVLLGAWTHSIWDSFTHDGGWAVQHFAVLRVSIVHAGVTALPLSYVLSRPARSVRAHFWSSSTSVGSAASAEPRSRSQFPTVGGMSLSRFAPSWPSRSLSPPLIASPRSSRVIWRFECSYSGLASILPVCSFRCSFFLLSFCMSSIEEAPNHAMQRPAGRAAISLPMTSNSNLQSPALSPAVADLWSR